MSWRQTPWRGLVALTVLLAVVLPGTSRSQGTAPGSVPGQSATRLPDGRWLLLGGEGPGGPTSTATLVDPATGTRTPVPSGLIHPRAWHSATVLPDGTVWIFGGVGPGGGVVADAELFDPTTQTFAPVSTPGLQPRAGHTATLLTDGRMLVAGGVSVTGAVLGDLELWDPLAQAGQFVAALHTPRQRAAATLLATGEVLLWGGFAGDGTTLTHGEVYEPIQGRVTPVTAPPAEPSIGPPRVRFAEPADGAAGVPLDAGLVLRVAPPLDPGSVTARTVGLAGPAGAVPSHLVAAEGGRLLFVTPEGLLAPGAAYTLRLDGVTGAGGRLRATVVRFTTAAGRGLAPPGGSAAAPPAPVDPSALDRDAADAEDAWEWRGERRHGRPYSRWQALPPLQAPRGTTALAGQVLRLNGQPLPHVTLEGPRAGGGTARARTDDTGRFLLLDLAAGHQALIIDGRSASHAGRTYGVFEVGVPIEAGRTTVLPYTIWMPRIHTEHAIPLPAYLTDPVVVTTPRMPGLEVHLPGHSAIRDHEGQLAPTISLTPIPKDRPPFPIPDDVDPPVYFTIQPGAGSVYSASKAGARIVYPNYRRPRAEPPGTRFHFWQYDPGGQGWHIYGPGAVTADGRQIVPDSGVEVYAFTGAMAAPPGFCGADCPPPSQGPAPGGGPSGGDPVDLAMGLFVLTKTDLSLPDVLPLALSRTYRPGDSASRPFGIGTTHPFQLFLYSAQQYTEADLILPDGGRVHYVRTSAGSGFSGAEFEHTASPTPFYKSRIVWNASASAWQLTRRDGTSYFFGGNAPLQRIQDRFGSAITLDRDAAGKLTAIRSPNGKAITLAYDAASRISEARDSLGRVVQYAYDASGRLATVTDPTGGVTEYTYDASHRMLTVKDPRGIVFLTNGYDANGRVFRQTQADSTTYQFAYTLDGQGRVTQADVTDPRGIVQRVTFDAATGYALSDTRAVGRPEQQATTYERQAGTNLLTAVVDPLGRRTAFTYDGLGNRTGVTRLAGTGNAVTTTYTYETTYSQLTSVTDPLSHTTSFGYNGQGALTSVTDPLHHTTTLTPNAQGHPTAKLPMAWPSCSG
jgi:YD repeat-containing protein